MFEIFPARTIMTKVHRRAISLQNSLTLITFEGSAMNLGATPSFDIGLTEVRVAKRVVLEVVVLKVVVMKGFTVVLAVVVGLVVSSTFWAK